MRGRIVLGWVVSQNITAKASCWSQKLSFVTLSCVFYSSNLIICEGKPSFSQFDFLPSLD